MPEQPPNFIIKWGSKGEGDGQFFSPGAVAVDSSDNVYVADELNHRIQKFDSDGIFITKWGSFGVGDGQFISHSGVAVDSDKSTSLTVVTIASRSSAKSLRQ
jgi:tripartite motif-containing protein 71